MTAANRATTSWGDDCGPRIVVVRRLVALLTESLTTLDIVNV